LFSPWNTNLSPAAVHRHIPVLLVVTCGSNPVIF
jgi:hypothetical protein